MNNSTVILSSLILSAGFFLAGLSVKSGIVAFKQSDRCVTVKGLAEREVKANKVIWSLTYKEIGSDPSAMYDVIEKKNQKVINFLLKGGIKEEEISVNSPSMTDRQADSYDNKEYADRYRAKSIITVTSDNVELVRKLMVTQGLLMKEGVALIREDWDNNSVRYEFTGLNDIKPEMVEEATKNARITAEKFAADSESKLGKIITAQQGNFSIEDRDVNTPFIKKIRVVNTMQYGLK